MQKSSDALSTKLINCNV